MVLRPFLGVTEPAGRSEHALGGRAGAQRSEPEWNLQRSGRFRVTGMNNEQEVKVQTRDPDRGNPTPRRQGQCCGTPRLSGREANAQRPARDGLKEVIGARRSRTKVKCRKACATDEPADGGYVQYLSVSQHVVATGSTRSLLFLPSEICRVPRKR